MDSIWINTTGVFHKVVCAKTQTIVYTLYKSRREK